jgi:YfiH family protein
VTAEPDDWYVESRPDVRILRARILDRVRPVAHAFSTRFDVGPARGATPEALARRRTLCEAAGLEGELLILEQEHGARALEARSGAGDALFALRAGAGDPILSVRTADCVPLLLAEEEGSAIAAIHAGWRGAAAGIVRATIDELAGRGLAPSRLVAAIGPAIGPCCYEVGPEVLHAVAERTGGTEERIRRRTTSGRPALDLSLAVSLQLVALGLAEARVSRAPWCTACRADLFFSYRREGEAAGRMMAVIGWRSAVP